MYVHNLCCPPMIQCAEQYVRGCCELVVDLITVVLDQSVTERRRKTNISQWNGADYFSECHLNKNCYQWLCGNESCLNSWSLWALCTEWKWLCINEVILKIKLTLQLTVCGLWNMSITLRDDGPLEPHRTHHLTCVCETETKVLFISSFFLLLLLFISTALPEQGYIKMHTHSFSLVSFCMNNTFKK